MTSQSERAICAEGLSKRYRLGSSKAAYRTLRDAIVDMVRAPFRRNARAEIWALKNVSFEVKRGEVLGIIGCNGAGKSTLLKVLSRITEPTSGTAHIRGRVATLLEVGTGFHPELSGRENIYLSGAILGLRRREIARVFDAIIDFAEIGPLLDTPVKHYSSGQYMRLAFAVAAHLDPEILLVDEVLAVGDYKFQKRCLERIRRVSETGETVILVSHNLGDIRNLSTRCMWLDKGQIVLIDSPAECVRRYVEASSARPSALDMDLRNVERPVGQGTSLRFTRLHLCPSRADGRIRFGEPLRMCIEFQVMRALRNLAFGFSIHALDGAWVCQSHSTHHGEPYGEVAPGAYGIDIEVTGNHLNQGSYLITLGARAETEALDWVKEGLRFEIVEEPAPDAWLCPINGFVRLPTRYGELVRLSETASIRLPVVEGRIA